MKFVHMYQNYHRNCFDYAMNMVGRLDANAHTHGEHQMHVCDHFSYVWIANRLILITFEWYYLSNENWNECAAEYLLSLISQPTSKLSIWCLFDCIFFSFISFAGKACERTCLCHHIQLASTTKFRFVW